MDMPPGAILLVAVLAILVDTVLLYNGFRESFTVDGAEMYFLGTPTGDCLADARLYACLADTYMKFTLRTLYP